MLWRKMIRDIKNNLSQFITIFLMIMIGVMAYTGIEAYMAGMKTSADNFYSEYNLQDLDVYGYLNSDSIQKILEIDGVKKVESKTTMVFDNNDIKDHKLELNFISSNEISKMYLDSGVAFDSNKHGIWLDSYYADKNNIKLGDVINLSYENINLSEKVLGFINTPDHVYSVKDGEIFPTHTDYGYAYLSNNELKNSSFPYTSLMVDINNSKNKNVIKEKIENTLNGVIVTDISDEESFSGYQSEIDEGKTYVGVFSGLFIFIAILSIITTMARVVKNDRVVIGTLKALGFNNRKIAFHYISYGLFISVIAGIFGLILGYFTIGKFFMDMEMMYFEVPNYSAIMAQSSYYVYLLVIILTVIVTYLATRKIVRVNASEILRVERPKVKTSSINITTIGIFKKLSFISRWNIRDILRNKARTITAIVGIVGCIILLVVGFGMYDTLNNYLKVELEDINNYKYKLNVSNDATSDDIKILLDKYPASSKTYGIEIKKNNGEKVTNNLFVDDAKGYIRFIDVDDNFMTLKTDGVYVTRKLAENMNYKIGDVISWHIYGEDKYYQTKIIGFNKDPQNQNVSISRSYFEKLGIEYRPDLFYTNINVDSKNVKGVSRVDSIDKVRSGVKLMMNNMITVILILIFFAGILAAVIIYNMGILSFSEKDYQFATLKVLGFSDKKISSIFIRQNIFITIVSIILGLPIGYYVLDYIFKNALGADYDFNVFVSTISYVYAAVGTFIVSLIVSWFLARKVKSIDMVKSLKGNE